MSDTILEQNLLINELFLSLQGESSFQGRLCAFIRLSGCNLRCHWCDTSYAFLEGKPMSIKKIIAEVLQMQCPLVEITGGEPLLQPNVYPLMKNLLDKGLEVLLETSGSIYLDKVPSKVRKIVDLKPPGSGEEEKNCLENLPLLKEGDELKFVLASREDYVWAKNICHQKNLFNGKVELLFSTAYGLLPPSNVAEWIIEDKLPVRFQLQQHKYIWSPTQRGV